MAQRYKRRFRNFFIKRNFQGKIILALFLAVTVGCLFFVVLFGFFSADTLTISYENNDLKVGNTPAMLFKNAMAANWIFLVTGGTLLVIIALIATHRIAGPLYRFEKTLDSMAAKNLGDTIRLRGKDEGKDLAEKINRFNQMLSADLKHINRRANAINDLCNHYIALQQSNLSPDDIDSIFTAIKKNNDLTRDILVTYQLLDDLYN